jgi:hypothetical protein
MNFGGWVVGRESCGNIVGFDGVGDEGLKKGEEDYYFAISTSLLG